MNLTDTQTLRLPPVLYGPVKNSVGYIHHVLKPSTEIGVTNIEDIQISPRIKEDLYHLDDGQAVIITERNNLSRPENVDGILKIKDDGNLQWLSHKALDAFEEDVHRRGLGIISEEILESWKGSFNYKTEKKDGSGAVTEKGLRPPQIGGLHAIGSHWSLSHQPATIVMPTGTGKTETMLASLTAYCLGNLLVVMPSKVLRDQTAEKFKTLGLLRTLNNLPKNIQNPIVGVIEKKTKVKRRSSNI